jgi:carboxymethylenebutenolidase
VTLFTSPSAIPRIHPNKIPVKILPMLLRQTRLAVMSRHACKLLAALALIFPAASLSAQDWAKAALAKSPRHYEYVPLKHGDRTVQAFVVYPEVKQKAPIVILIHEIFGLSDWAKEMADDLAAQGFIVIAPDLLTGAGPNGGGTESFAPSDVNRAVSGLNADQVTADLDAAADYGKKLPSANGKLFVAGFCWGGGKSFAYATHRHDLSAAFVFYGTPPPDVTAITAPVYGFYAGNDARVTATIPAATDAMKAAGKKYEPVVYDGAGHGFMRAGEDPAPPAATSPEMAAANKKARDESFKRLVMLINKANTGSATIHLAPTRTRPAPVTSATAKPAPTPAICHDEKLSTQTADTSMPDMDMSGAM